MKFETKQKNISNDHCLFKDFSLLSKTCDYKKIEFIFIIKSLKCSATLLNYSKQVSSMFIIIKKIVELRKKDIFLDYIDMFEQTFSPLTYPILMLCSQIAFLSEDLVFHCLC